jgi:hypothetical protein
LRRSSKYGPLKRGDIGSDGRVFFAYSSGREMWYSEERFKEKLKTCKNYEVRDREVFDKKDHPPLWFYDLNKRLYYVGKNGSKERWVAYGEYLTIRRRRERIGEEYKNRCDKLEKIPYNFGDPHPSIPGLFFAYHTHNKPCWKDRVNLEKYAKSRREVAGRCVRKCRIRKDRVLRKIDNRVKRGTILDGKVFWDYNTYGRETWIELAEYERRKSDSRERTKRYRARKKFKHN